MDIVYLYNKKYVRWNELLYSIRSVEKFYPKHGTIWIIGDKPEWAQNIKHIPHESQHTNNQVNKANNINERLFLAASNPHISTNFIWMADDYCIVNPITDSFIKKNIISRGDYNNIVYRKTLEKYYKGANHPYKKILKHTLELTKKKGYSSWDYEAHTPFLFNKNKLLRTFKTFGKTNFIISTAYGNMHYKNPLVDTFRGFKSPIGIRFLYRDRRDPQTIEWARDRMKGLYYINYDDFGLSEGLKEAIVELLPDKSKYESTRTPSSEETSLAPSQHKARKLRPVILSCDNRLDTLKIFIESYKKIADSMLQPIILAGYNYPERRQEYTQLLEQLNPYKIIEQVNHYMDIDPTEVLKKTPKRYRRLNYINVQKTMTKDFPRIALEHSEEDVIFIEDDSLFSSQFPEAVEKVSQYLQSDCDFITIYSPTTRYDNKGYKLIYDTRKKITDGGYSTSPHLPSNDFVHAINGNHYYGNVCAAFSRKVLTKLNDNWEEVESLATAWDDRWGLYMVQESFRMYATRASYVQHQHGYSVLNDEYRKVCTNAFHDLEIPKKDIHFKIIVPVYNAEKWISKNIKSIQSQDYTNYKVIIIDDCSTDNTHDTAFELIKNDKRFTLIRNGERGGAMSSSVIGTNAANARDEDVIVKLDGDDWLAREDALSIIKETYDTKNCLMTYGSYLDYPAPVKQPSHGWGDGGIAIEYPEECIIKNNFREHDWLCPHLRTYKYHIWKRIEDSAFRDTGGEYYSMSSDVAIMLPILEMAGARQVAIPEILYIYNKENPINDHKVSRKLQSDMEARIKEKKKYLPIDKPKMLRPFILTCDMRLDMFREFVESYKAVAHTMLPPIVFAGFYDPEKREEYGTLIQELNPHVVIEQPNYIDDDEVDITIRKSGYIQTIRSQDPRYLNLQKIVVKDFPRIALEHSEEDIIWIEDDTIFSSQFPEAVEKASQHLQSDCDFITLYSPTLQYYNSDGMSYGEIHKKGDPDKWNLENGITENGYTTKQSLPSNDFIHAINGNNFHGTPCVILSREVLTVFKYSWKEMEIWAPDWDLRWGIHAERVGFRVYATRKSYVQHQRGASAIDDNKRDTYTKTFVE